MPWRWAADKHSALQRFTSAISRSRRCSLGLTSLLIVLRLILWIILSYVVTVARKEPEIWVLIRFHVKNWIFSSISYLSNEESTWAGIGLKFLNEVAGNVVEVSIWGLGVVRVGVEKVCWVDAPVFALWIGHELDDEVVIVFVELAPGIDEDDVAAGWGGGADEILAFITWTSVFGWTVALTIVCKNLSTWSRFPFWIKILGKNQFEWILFECNELFVCWKNYKVSILILAYASDVTLFCLLNTLAKNSMSRKN